jgi:hypothetical protein
MNLRERQIEAESKHEFRLSELRSLVKHGDWKKVEEKTGLTQANVHHAFKRIGSVHHLKVVAALELVIKERIDEYQK